MLPLTVLRQLDGVLEPIKGKVVTRAARYGDREGRWLELQSGAVDAQALDQVGAGPLQHAGQVGQGDRARRRGPGPTLSLTICAARLALPCRHADPARGPGHAAPRASRAGTRTRHAAPPADFSRP